MSRFTLDGLLPLWSEWQTAYDDEPEGRVPATARQIVVELASPYIPPRGDKGARAGIDATGKEAAVESLIRQARSRYLRVYFDWLSRAMPEGGWKPDRRAWLGAASAEIPRDMVEDGWRRLWGKGRGNPGFFNQLHDEHYPPLGSAPAIDLYMTIFGWWRENIGSPFRPNFDETDLSWKSTDPDSDLGALSHLNPAARFMLRVVQAVDERYTVAHCANVHREYARRQRATK